MSVFQVEEYYLYIDLSKYDIEAVKAACDEEGLDFIPDDPNEPAHATIETFYSEHDAESFLDSLS